ncbi:hypothetical protein ANO14919_038110 [Xylariales sp. No.14919]|nr:hypothetical protein ANO14919_038110 [Xylariales sp. No.14919]
MSEPIDSPLNNDVQTGYRPTFERNAPADCSKSPYE